MALQCRLNCTCRVCGRVRLHCRKRVRRSAKPQPVDEAAARLEAALAAIAAGRPPETR
jgi:hypothetical protein